jgi:hypothetical protein
MGSRGDEDIRRLAEQNGSEGMSAKTGTLPPFSKGSTGFLGYVPIIQAQCDVFEGMSLLDGQSLQREFQP